MTSSCKNFENKTLLMVAYDFPPLGVAGVHRNLSIVKHFASMGWRIIVLTVKENQKIFSSYDWSLMESVPDSVIVVRTDLIEPYDNIVHRTIMGTRYKFTRSDSHTNCSGRSFLSSKIRRHFGNFAHSCMIPDRFMGWIPYAIKSGIKIIKKYQPNLILSESPTIACHIIGHYLSRRFKVPWVLDFHDPWTTYAFGLKRIFPLNMIEKYYEKKLLSAGDRIITTADSLKKEFQTLYPKINKQKFHVVYNGYDNSIFDNIAPKVFDKFTMVFLGTVYEDPLHQDFFSGIKIALSREPLLNERLQVLFIGNTFPNFSNLIDQYELNGIVFEVGYRTHQECIQYLVGAHAAYYHVYNYNQISCKLFEYLRSGTHILAILPEGHEAQRIIEATSSGLICYLNEPNQFAENLLHLFYKHSDQKLYKLDPNVPMIKYYDRTNMSGDFYRIVDQLISEK
jgi:glycosyltransferase involved in cell wall biosynthesis